ncbi:MAG: glucans biosynthesis glucosyltransferase MdoH [Pseudomonadales bacterium]|jgi:membrane glycosyltransferase|nr:glucans biosynthesis glucosyltransferase MdoH [Pseudomonadales bacterium]
MPRQPVDAPAVPLRAHPGARLDRLGRGLARVFLAAGTVALTAYGVTEMHGVLTRATITPLQVLFLVLFAVNFAWVAFAACNALIGAVVTLARLDRRRDDAQAEVPLTAVLMPVYNETPERVAAAIRVMRDGLAAEAAGRFAFFILSDTNRADAWIHEEAVFRALIDEADSDCPVYYRHRLENRERKAGNIADWVTGWGGAWEAMVVLDADSLMAPATLLRMARRLAADPGLGLLQTLPGIVRAGTLHARLQQFANRCYGAVSGAGLAAWHGLSSNFWGHNAIIRVAAFADAARLPMLAGRPPFGGAVLSHDFVEAALLRRRGWGVRLDTDLPGSFEEAPPSLADVLVRDRRWCQGNLQHARLLAARGLAGITRVHLFSGIMAYASAVLWFGLVLVGLLLGVQAALTRPEYFVEPSLFPTWPVFDAARAVDLFLVSLAVVLTPKLLGVLTTLLAPRRLLGFGGPVSLLASAVVEITLSALLAPIMMLAQTRIVAEVLLGRDSGWSPQRRDDGAIGARDALRAHAGQVVAGALLAGLAAWLHRDLFLWLLPVTAGLVLAPLLSWLGARRTAGRVLSALTLLRTPEERRERALVERLEAELERHPPCDPEPPIQRLCADPGLFAWHLAQLPKERRPFDPELEVASAKQQRSQTRAGLEIWLTAGEKFALLGAPDRLAPLLDRAA